MGTVRVDYVIGESGKTAIEEDMARYGRAKQTRWLVQQIQRLDERDIDRDFNALLMGLRRAVGDHRDRCLRRDVPG